MKTVFLWIADFGTAVHPDRQYDCSLFFSSKEKFAELYTASDVEKQQLVPIQVVETFDNLDYIPDNY